MTNKFKFLYNLAMKCFHSELEWKDKSDIIFLLIKKAEKEIPVKWSFSHKNYEGNVRAAIIAWQEIIKPLGRR